MTRTGRSLTAVFAVLVVVGTVVSAAAAGNSTPHATPTASESPEPEPSDSPDAQVADQPDSGGSSQGGADFSACVGLTGLENAICRVTANQAAHPQAVGLATALSHLQANLASHSSGAQGASHGQSGLHGPAAAGG
ncbi:MAG: hypothetical protein HY240_09545 [Actinobacteria bacterium]|nr:hypothetical protein [Actinomycetota bacterium]